MVVVGETAKLPDSGKLPPLPGIMVTEVALVVVQVSVEGCPAAMVAGEAAN